MGSTRHGMSEGEAASTKAREKTARCGAEIGLIDYFAVVWRHRRLVVLVSVLPAVVTGAIMMFWPRNYRVTYTYDMRLDEKEYRILLDTFFSEQNLGKLVSRLKSAGLSAYAGEISSADTSDALQKLVSFKVSPSYFDALSSTRKVNVGDVEEIRQVRGTLLTMTITGRPRQDMEEISAIIRDDFEKVVPTYSLKSQLMATIAEIKGKMADVEQNRFALELALESGKSAADKLRNLMPGDPNLNPGGIVLQFNDVAATGEYLPLAYQIQVTDSNIVRLEERISTNEKNHAYYTGLLGLNERILGQMRDKTSSYYTIKEFHEFLAAALKEYGARELADYLSAYSKKIENIMSKNVPVIEGPRIYPMAKGVVKRTATVFAALLMAAVFGAFLLEGAKERTLRAA